METNKIDEHGDDHACSDEVCPGCVAAVQAAVEFDISDGAMTWRDSGRRGDDESREEAAVRQAAAIERLRLDREAFVEQAKRDGVYRPIATGKA